MRRNSKIQINTFKLNRLLSKEQMNIYERIVASNVFCNHCGDICKKGITVNEIALTDLNCILVEGTCNTCKGQVSRVMEFGEDEGFCKRAKDFRESIGK